MSTDCKNSRGAVFVETLLATSLRKSLDGIFAGKRRASSDS
jgi:hypothetical protein